MSEQLLEKIIEELQGIKQLQQETKQEQYEMKLEQQGTKQELVALKQEQYEMKLEQQGTKQELAALRQEQQGMKQEQRITNERLTNIETKQSLIYNQTGKLTEYHTEIMSSFEKLATKDDLVYYDKKIGEHDRHLFKNR
ncbi:hypothetical protein [Oceanobacillus bengalensis]|uniref:Uncharacterized protein n=1 Tax=Oceanobacillus bengalensis TaxID=1435466 RepID=A0A494YXC9_9BACI|nr:hypothetical protein [Oceanobacillus bengalensis]RKQ14770.1 hypothetical protein D8M05_12035 [Oceanobacillus bengalensis]